ncbi:MAG: hypothetical protein ACQGVK_21115 [Myxococcota bacterium]
MTRFHRSTPTVPGSSGLRLALLVAAIALPTLASPVLAEDRPETLVYDTPGPVPTLSRDDRHEQKHEVVIEDQALSPRTVVLWQGEEINWLSLSRSPSTIVFEREVARSLVCHSLVNFHLEEDELRSADLHVGDRAGFCELAPGRYRYRVVRRGHGEAQGLAGARRLDGWIVVHPRPVATATP